MRHPRVTWPEGKRFAFTIVDDTDSATLSRIKPIYDLLIDLGFRTTKTVWPLRSAAGTTLDGDTLQDDPHRAWILGLQARGFEIAYHGAAAQASTRVRSREALDLFRNVVGSDPRVYAAHSGQYEALYWGPQRLHGISRVLFASANRLGKREVSFHGEREDSPYFWGDLCHERIEYTRNFTFTDIDTLRSDPEMPYHDPSKPLVRYWFSSSNAPQRQDFVNLISEANQDRLAEAGGACIAYTHFAYKFVKDGVLDPEFARLMTRLASLGGWYVPASAVLDHLKTQPGWTGQRSARSLAMLQWRWISDNLRTGRGRKYLRRIRQRFGL